MGAATYSQPSFLGGEWSLSFQGRTDNPRYKTAMAQCVNSFPLEEGAWTRRPGFLFMGTTRGGAEAQILKYAFANSIPYLIELTAGHLRMFNGLSLVLTTDAPFITAISNANPAAITCSGAPAWVTGDTIQFVFDPTTAGKYPDVLALLKNRQFIVTVVDTTHFTLTDALTGATIDGSTLNYSSSVTIRAQKVYDLVTPFTGTTYQTARIIQSTLATLLVQNTVPPQVFTFVPGTTSNQVLSAQSGLVPANILDGPYLDIDSTGAFITPELPNAMQPNIVDCFVSFPFYDANTPYNKGALVYDGVNGYISLVDVNLGNTPASSPNQWLVTTYQRVNGPNGFSTYDIGRCVRLFCEPPEYVAGTTYATGDPVQFGGLYYVSIVDSNTGNEPDTSLAQWNPSTALSVATWTWGRIITTTPASGAAFQLEILGPEVLYHDGVVSVNSFRLGLYGNILGGGQGYPSCGCYQQGRLWLSGAVPNRIDASNTNDPMNFAPTYADGTVQDNNGISAVFNAEELDQIFWMTGTSQGIVCGTASGEWLVQAGTLNDPITPTSIVANQVTHYGCANVLPVKTGLALVFVQKFGKKVLEFLADVFSGKFSAPNITEAAKHLTAAGVQEIKYQNEPLPIIWARLTLNSAVEAAGAGILAGLTYRRTSSFVTDLPSLAAWHHSICGGALFFESLAVTPSPDTTVEVLNCVVNDTAATYRHVMQSAPLMQEIVGAQGSIYDANFLDDSIVPPPALITTSGGKPGLQIYGLWHLNGQSVDAWIGGLDFGSYTVAGGTIFVPFSADPDGIGTENYLTGLSTIPAVENSIVGQTPIGLGAGATPFNIPIVIGHSFVSQGQILRPGTAVDAGAQNGPPGGKIRRIHQFAVQFINTVTQAVSFAGQDSQEAVVPKIFPAIFKTRGGTNYTRQTLFTGMYRQNLNDDYNMDSMLYWQVTRPYPATIAQVTLYLHTQDA